MNIYLVVSEDLVETIWEDWFNQVGHEDHYCIAELVIANTPNQAKWLAWKADKSSFTGDVSDKPKMSCRKKSTLPMGLGDSPGIVSNNPAYQFAWEAQPRGVAGATGRGAGRRAGIGKGLKGYSQLSVYGGGQ